MAQFTDDRGRVWSLNLTLGSAHELAKETGIDLLDIGQFQHATENPSSMLAAFGFSAKLFQILLVLTRDQRRYHNVSDAEFAAALRGEAVAAALKAYQQELQHFFAATGLPLYKALADAGKQLVESLSAAGQASTP